MQRIGQLFRIAYINYVFAKHGLDQVILGAKIFAPVRFLAYLNPWNVTRNRNKGRGERIREALEQLGPIFVKFGQMLSTRHDLLPDDIALELSKLQDQVQPFSSEQAIAIIEKIYGGSVDNLFSHFDKTPLASASIAQVHSATLLDGRDVIVKVLRPKVRRVIQRDVSILYTLARLAERSSAQARRFHVIDVIHEFEQTLMDELDLMREAANASQLRRNFQDSADLYVPEIFWPYARNQVMVMERIHGIPISNIEALQQAGIDLKVLAETGVRIFFTQVFRDCFFHADMHPGNIFVSRENVKKPQYVAVDFGIMGSLNDVDQHYLATNFLAFFNRDYREVARLHIESNWVDADTRLDQFESAIRTVCEPLFEKPLKDISVGLTLLRLYQTARRFNMEVQPQLVLLQKTLLSVEGLGRQLYPELNLWDTAKPFLQEWTKKRISPRALLRRMRTTAPTWLSKVPELPGLVSATLEQAHAIQARQQQALEAKGKQGAQKRQGGRRIMLGLGSGLLLLSAVSFVISHPGLWVLLHSNATLLSSAVIGVILCYFGIDREKR